uniref:Uncharacterized protein n=1 Tax=Anguilla anguilla TaxID=7936 RepID=A0A0E9QL04_ANGAN
MSGSQPTNNVKPTPDQH